MARPAGDGRAAALLRLLAPAPGRLEFAARLALICALTTLVTQMYQTPSPALTAYVAFFVTKPDRAESLLLCVVNTLVVTVVIGFVFLVAQVVVDVAAWRVAAMAAISFGLLFLVSASKLRPLGGTMALIVAYALDLLGTLPPGEVATRGLLYAWLFVAIPAGVSLVVNLAIAPSPRRMVQQALAERLRLAAAVLRSPADADVLRELVRQRREGDGEIASRLKLAGAERTSPAQDIAALRQATDATVALLSALDLMTRTPRALLPESLRHAHARTLDEMAGILAAGGYPVNVVPPSAQDEALDPLAASVHAALADALARYAEAPTAPAAAPAKQPTGFLVPDATTNPDHLRYAAKTTAAAMFCYLVYSQLDWPGIHTCMITCYIVSLVTLADSVEKLTLRIAGALLGAALGEAAMVYAVPPFDSIGALLCIVFVGAFASAWIAAGSPRIAYAGFQTAFAFFLCVVQGSAPAFDLTVARDRVIGIIFGNVVVYLVSTRCWPASLGARIESGIAAALRHLGLMVRATDAAARRHLAAQAQAALGAVEEDLELARYEPASVRPASEWLERRRAIAERAADLEPPLLLAAETQDPSVAGVARRLDRLAGDVAAAADPVPEAAVDPTALRPLLEKRLRDLESAVAADAPHQGVPHAVA